MPRRRHPGPPLAVLTLVVPATSTLVDQGTRVGEIVAAHPAEVAVLSAVDKHTAAAPAADPADAAAGAKAVGEIAKAPGTTVPQSIQLLQSLGAPDVQRDLALVSRYGGILTAANAAIPADDLAYLSAHGDEVVTAQQDNPGQWQRWWWVCVIAQALFLPFVFVMAGRWSPKKPRPTEGRRGRARAARPGGARRPGRGAGLTL